MSPAGWLLVAAAALILAAGWCAAAHDAMVRADPDGLEIYGGLLTFIRVCAEVSAAVLVTLAFAHWLGGGWQVFLPAAGVLLVAMYVLIGVGPRPLGRKRAEKMAATATKLLRPLRRALGPLPHLLDRLTGVLPLGARGKRTMRQKPRDEPGTIRRWNRRRMCQDGEGYKPKQCRTMRSEMRWRERGEQCRLAR